MKNYFCFSFVTILALLLVSCGRAYFPIELEGNTRTERNRGQQNLGVEIISMTTEEIKKANSDEYQRRVIDASDLTKPARILPLNEALVEKYPDAKDPGPYVLGAGDQVRFSEIFEQNQGQPTLVSRDLVISDDGFLNIYEIGRIKAVGLTQSQLEDLIYRGLLAAGRSGSFELSISAFKSKSIVIIGDDLKPLIVPFTSSPIFLEDVISNVSINKNNNSSALSSDAKITLLRSGREYTFSLQSILKSSRKRFRLFPDDRIFVTGLLYKKELVQVIGETGAQSSLPISGIQRPTLSNIIFSGSVLNNVTSDFSQIYVLRGKSKKMKAYHLDITNPARVKLANLFEMRPDDIVYVATQPLSLYSRALSQILGSTALTLQARDTIKSEIGN